jgi:uncharacterized RDD family membrane protein YckC
MRLTLSVRHALAIAALVLSSTVAIAQAPPPTTPQPAPGAVASPPEQPARPEQPAPPEPPEPLEQPELPGVESSAPRRDVVRIGQDVVVRAGELAGDVVVISGSATIEGRVNDLVVILGTAHLGSTAIVAGDMVVVGGGATIEEGAQAERDLVVVGGSLSAPPGFTPGREHVVVGPAFGPPGLTAVRAVMPWVTGGLMLGRPIVPSLGWIWAVVGVVFFVYLLLLVLFPRAIGVSVDTLAEKPLTAFLAGLIVLLLVGPVTMILAISVVGLAVIPLALCALVIAWMVGTIAVARWMGARLVVEDQPDRTAQAVRSFVIGFVLICVLYMIPFVGFLSWTIIGVFGLGAATLAFAAAFRRENPPPERPEPVPGPLPPPTGWAPPSLAHEAAAPTASDAPGAVPPPASGVAAAVVDLTAFPRAGFLQRLAAFVLDVLLVVIVENILDFTNRPGAWLILLLAYHVGFWTWKGTTVGGIICRLRLVRVDGTPLRFADALVRGLSGIFSIVVLGLGFLWILRDPERQAWHDTIAGTYVVTVPRQWPI